MRQIKSLYICGDSFCVEDVEYGHNWVGLLKNKCPNLKIVNLSLVGASNYLIYLQVKHAIEQNCDYLIYHATSSIRHEFSVNKSAGVGQDSIFRYYNLQNSEPKEVFCTSWITSSKYKNILSKFDCAEIKDFYLKYIDLSSTIEKNLIFIKHSLQQLTENSNIQWAWSRAGFEHNSFGDTIYKNQEFCQWRDNECSINLWNYINQKVTRPYFHVTDIEISNQVANWYIEKLHL